MSVIEAMLLRWGESPTGRTVTFLLPEDTAQHPFKGLKTGPSNGQRLALSIALINDDETQSEAPEAKPAPAPVEDKPHRPADPARRRSRQAAMLCNDARFRKFIIERHPLNGVTTPIPEMAALLVRKLCEVESRSEFDTDAEAGERWDRLYADYQLWLVS